MTITQVSGNSFADRAGVKAGDKIVGYKKQSSGNFSVEQNDQAFKDFIQSCQKGEKIDLLIERNGIQFQATVERNVYTETYVRYVDASGSYGFLGEGENITFEKIEGLKKRISDIKKQIRNLQFLR